MKARPRALDGSWRCVSRIPKNTSIGDLSKKFEVLSRALPRNSAQLCECCGEGQHTPNLIFNILEGWRPLKIILPI